MTTLYWVFKILYWSFVGVFTLLVLALLAQVVVGLVWPEALISIKKRLGFGKKGRKRRIEERDFSVQLGMLLAVVVSVVFAGFQTFQLREQIELENRPFVSIEDPHWWHEQDGLGSFWLGLGFFRRNYGEKPAEELEFRNLRAAIISIDEEGIAKKVTLRTPEGNRKYLDEYILDERNRLILQLMDILAQYFRTHPDVSKVDLEKFLKSLALNSKTVQGAPVLVFEGKPLFDLVEVNNEMAEYLQRQRVSLFPSREGRERRILMQQMGKGLADVVEGRNLLVTFFAFRYRSPLMGKSYSSFLLGFGDRNFRQQIQGFKGFLLQTFQSWSSEEAL